MSDHFETTRWSLVMDVQASGPAADAALSELCRDYWSPLHRYGLRIGCSHEDAEDHVQGFFSQVIASKLFDRAEPELGRLRTFLLTAFRRYVQDQWSKAGAVKRGGEAAMVSLDEERQLPAHAEDEQWFDRQWAYTVLELANKRLAERYTLEQQQPMHDLLRPYIVETEIEGGYAALAQTVGLSEGATRVAVHRIRKRFGEALRSEVLETLAEPESLDVELRYLMGVLAS